MRPEPPARSSVWIPALGYLLLALAWTWPLPLHAGTRFAHDPGDPLLNTFILWWNARVVPLSRAMWNAPFYWPMRDALALTEHDAGIGLVASPIQWLGGSALLAYNLVLIASAWWSGLAVHALVRRIVRAADPRPGVAGAAAWSAGVIWGFAPYRASQLAHLQVLVAWWMPLALLALHAYYADGRRRWLALFGAAWLLQALSNGYYMFFFPILVAAWIVCLTRWPGEWRRAGAAAGTWVLASLPLLPVLREYYTVQHRLSLFRTRVEMHLFSATWASLGHASPLLRFWPSHEPKTQEDFLFPGLAGLLAVAAAVVLRRVRGGLVRPFVFYGGAALFCTWLAAGPSPDQWSAGSLSHAYDWIAWLPGYAGLRVPARFFMLATLCLSVAAGIGVASLAGATRRKTVGVAAAISVLAILDGWIVPMPLGAPPRPFGTTLTAHARVLELPVDDDNVNVAAMFRATLHGLPVVNGYAGYVPPHMQVIAWALKHGDRSIFTPLRRGRPLYVVVASNQASPRWAAFMDAQHDAEMIDVSGAGRLYLLPAVPSSPEVSAGIPIAPARAEAAEAWLTFDLGSPRRVRAIELRTDGDVAHLPPALRIETSTDGLTWAPAADEPIGALALDGALREPLAVPLRVALPDPPARFLRVNAAAFAPAAVTILGP